jgi:hypothetical protein
MRRDASLGIGAGLGWRRWLYFGRSAVSSVAAALVLVVGFALSLEACLAFWARVAPEGRAGGFTKGSATESTRPTPIFLFWQFLLVIHLGFCVSIFCIPIQVKWLTQNCVGAALYKGSSRIRIIASASANCRNWCKSCYKEYFQIPDSPVIEASEDDLSHL